MKTIQELVNSFQNRKSPCFSGEPDLTYKQVHGMVLNLARGFLSMGLKPGDRVMLLSKNRVEWMLICLALNYAGLVDVPRGERACDTEINYIIKHSAPRVIIVEDDHLFQRVSEHRSHHEIISIEQVKGLKNYRDILKRGEKKDYEIPPVTPDTPASHLYTSGTVAEPKGVILTHGNYMSNMTAGQARIDVEPTDLALCILPLWHSFERLVEYVILGAGGCLCYSSLAAFKNDLLTIKPTILAVVPRILETIFDKKIMKKVQEQSPTGRSIFKMMVDLSAFSRRRGFNPLRFLGYLPRQYMEGKVFSKLKESMGGRMKLLISGGGKLRKDIDYFFHAAGIPILEGYGLTETSPVISVRSPDNFTLGTVGPPLDNLQVRILDAHSGGEVPRGKEGVLFVKGPSVSPGYYLNAYETKKSFREGWFDTGDLAYLDGHGNIVITGRFKDIIVLSNGENIGPERIEQTLKKSPFIANAVVLGQDWKGLGALIEPDFETLWELHKIKPADLESQKAQKLFRREIRDLVNPLEGFREFECIKSFRILNKPMERGRELTETLKVKRRVVNRLYSNQIESINVEINGKKEDRSFM